MTDETLFAAALEKADPADRAAYLDAACAGDPEQRKRVAALLAALEEADGFLEAPVADPAQGAETRTVLPPAEPSDTLTATDSEPSRAGGEQLGFLAPPARPGSVGRLGHYEILEVVGRGGFGIVLKAIDERLRRVVAVKILAPLLATNGTARARFVREARSGAAVRDEHVVNIHAVSGDDEAVPFLVMEFVSGQTLQQKLDKSGPLSVAEVLRIGYQTACGLAAAHAQGLIHRDIKPANILLENGVERVKLSDFGLARAADDASISQSGVVAGTPMYMSPEQARGEALDHRSDLFSLGTVLYTLCTGRPPFRADTTLAVLKRVVEDTPRPIREVNPQIPRWLADVVARLHAKNPDERFQTAKEVAELLGRYLSEFQQFGEVRSAAPAPEAPKRRSWGLVAEGALLVVAAAGLVAYLLTRTGPEPAPEGANSPAPKAPAPNPDEGRTRFSDGQKLSGWGLVIDPEGDSRFEVKGGNLRIAVPPKDRDLSARAKGPNAPRVLREVRGDFRARVRVLPFADVGARAPAPAEPSARITLADVLDLRAEDVENTFEGRRLAGRYPVGRDGTVHIGTIYGGPIAVYGLTPKEAGEAIQKQARQFAPKAIVSAALAPPRAGAPTGPPATRVEPLDTISLDAENVFEEHPLNRQYLVGRDGTVNLGASYGGAVRVAGLTPKEAGEAIQKQVRNFARKADVSVALAPAPAAQAHLGGWLIVWKDSEHLLGAGRSAVANSLGERECRHDFWYQWTGPQPLREMPEEFWRARPDVPSHLEIDRRGAVIRLRTSADGVRWSEAIEVRPPNLPAVLQVGVAATSLNAGSEFRVEFDGFEVVSAAPEPPAGANPVNPKP